MKKTIIVAVAAAVVFGAAGFWGGMGYGRSQAALALSPARGGFPGGAGIAGAGTTGQRFVDRGGIGTRGAVDQAGVGFVAGEVVSKDATSITLKLADGGSRVALLSTSTQILTSRAGTVEDVAIGGQLTIQGTVNADGSIFARTIQVRSETLGGQ